MGAKYDTRVAYFYNAPWKTPNLEAGGSRNRQQGGFNVLEIRMECRQGGNLKFRPPSEVRQGRTSLPHRKRELDYADIIATNSSVWNGIRAAFEAMRPTYDR